MNDALIWINNHSVLVAIVTVWTFIWKGIALWKASQRKEKTWFVAMLLLNTIGLLEMFYALYWSERQSKK